MTVGIYAIRHVESGKRYIGKSVNVEYRLIQHKSLLTKPIRSKDCNRHLYNAVQKYGWHKFVTEVVEKFDHIDEAHIAARELFWMDEYNTCDRKYGYNLRRDSSTKMIVHEETRALQAISMLGEGNPNYGNNWSETQKDAMRLTQQLRHIMTDAYGEDWRKRQSEAQRTRWENTPPEKRAAMAEKVSNSKIKYDYEQYDRTGEILIRTWSSVKEIVSENPTWKWQNIYSVCHGHKPTYRGFVWRQVPKLTDFEFLLGDIAA